MLNTPTAVAPRTFNPGVRLIAAIAAAAVLAVLCISLARNAPGPHATVVAEKHSAVTRTTALFAAAQKSMAAADQSLRAAVKNTNAYATLKAADDKAHSDFRAARDASATAVTAQQDADSQQRDAAASPYFAWFGVLALALLWLISAVLAQTLNPFALAMGLDNRLSTSKFQALIWTAAVAFVYAAIYADRLISYGYVNPIDNLPQNVLFALGLSATSVVAAKAITSSQVSTNPNNKDVQQAPSYDPSALVRDDGSTSPSLTKVQVLFWTVIGVVVYATTSMHVLGTVASCPSNCAFPDIDTALMIFMGLGHATYIGGKLVGAATPSLSGATADPANPGNLILSGSNLGTSGSVLVNDTALDPALVISWSATAVSFRLPTLSNGAWSAGDQITLAVNVGGAVSPATTYVVPGPTGTDAAPQTAPRPKAFAAFTLAKAVTTAPPVLLRGIDVSFAQGMLVDWRAAKNSGACEFTYARATYAADPTKSDENFARNHDECKAAGIPFGAYHFFVFSVPGAAQARNFLQRIDGRSGTLMPMVDVEEQSGHGGSTVEMIQNLSSFVSLIERELGTKMLVYTNQDSWNSLLGGTDGFAGHKLWVANYTQTPGNVAAMPRGFADWTIHQYSMNGQVPLVDGSFGDVDLDVLKGPLTNILHGAAAPGGIQAPPAPMARGKLASVVYDGIDKRLKGFDAQGALTFNYEAHNDSVAPNAWRADAGCPPGSYRLTTPQSNDPTKPNNENTNNWIGEGLWFIELVNIPGHSGIGIHGGGSCVPVDQALADHQGWCPTMNCIRLQNIDLKALAAMPLDGLPIRVLQSAF